jgi:hypothetical protein
MIDGFSNKPQDYKKRIDKIITLITADIERSKEAINMLQELVSETVEIKPM